MFHPNLSLKHPRRQHRLMSHQHIIVSADQFLERQLARRVHTRVYPPKLEQHQVHPQVRPRLHGLEEEREKKDELKNKF
jgi:hypothetical protein